MQALDSYLRIFMSRTYGFNEITYVCTYIHVCVYIRTCMQTQRKSGKMKRTLHCAK